MRQVNLQMEDRLLETVKEVAKASGLSMSEVMRRALEALPLGTDGAVTVGATVVEKAATETGLLEIRDRFTQQDAALQAAAKAIGDLVRRLQGPGARGDVESRVEKMSEWAGLVEKRLTALEANDA